MVGAYACALLHNDVVTYKVMDREQLEAARELSKSSAYDGKFAMEMYLKTPIKRLCKTLPLKDPRVAQVVALEDLHENIVPDPIVVEVDTREREEAMDAEVIEEELADMDVKKTELPEETREEINERILGNMKLLVDFDEVPVIHKPVEHYTGKAPHNVARDFADHLSRLVLTAERANR